MKNLSLPIVALIITAGCSPRASAPAAPPPAPPPVPAVISVPAPAAAIPAAAVPVPAAPIAAPVAAKPPGKPTPQSVERLLDLTQAHRSYDALTAQVRQVNSRILAQAAARYHLTPAQRAKLTAQADKLFAENQSRYSWDKAKPIYVGVYSASFNQQDVDTIIAFYESPTGRTFIAKLTSSWQKSDSLFRSQLFPILQKTDMQVQALAAQLAPPPAKPAQPPAKPVQPVKAAQPAQPAASAVHSP